MGEETDGVQSISSVASVLGAFGVDFREGRPKMGLTAEVDVEGRLSSEREENKGGSAAAGVAEIVVVGGLVRRIDTGCRMLREE